MSECLDYGGIKQRIAAFDARHGAYVVYKGWMYFEDGATRERDPLGGMIEPPDDLWERAKLRAFYSQLILQSAVTAFDERKAALMSFAQANLAQNFCNPAPPTEQTTAELKALQQSVLQAKAKHEQALAEVETNKPAQLRERERQNASNRQANESLLASLRSIEV